MVSFFVKLLYGLIICDVARDNIVIRIRHSEVDVRFVHLKARTERLHQTAIHRYPIVWEALPSECRVEIVTGNIGHVLGVLKREILKCGLD